MRHEDQHEAFVPGLAPLGDLEMLQFFGGDGASNAEKAAAAGISTPTTDLPFREQLESSFGADLSHIQAHKGAGASAACRALGAHAYATGNHVVFGSEDPNLFQVAHEVAHTFQQNGGIRKYAMVGERGDPFEHQADAAATQVVSGQRVDVASLTGRSSSTPHIQRDTGGAAQPAAANAAPPAPRSYLPPPELTLGILPADTDVVSVSTRDLYDAMNNAVYYAVPANAGVYTPAFSRMSSFDFVRGNLRNMTNGGGVTEVLPPYTSGPNEYTGTVTVRAHISNVRFQSADGVAITSGSSGGPSTNSSSGIGNSVGVNANAGVKAGDAKAGGEGSAGVGAGVSDTSSQSAGGGWSGGGSTGMAATASVRFTFDVSFSVTVSIDHEPTTWASVVTLGVGNLVVSGRKSRTIAASGNGVLRAAAARCIPVN